MQVLTLVPILVNSSAPFAVFNQTASPANCSFCYDAESQTLLWGFAVGMLDMSGFSAAVAPRYFKLAHICLHCLNTSPALNKRHFIKQRHFLHIAVQEHYIM